MITFQSAAEPHTQHRLIKDDDLSGPQSGRCQPSGARPGPLDRARLSRKRSVTPPPGVSGCRSDLQEAATVVGRPASLIDGQSRTSRQSTTRQQPASHRNPSQYLGIEQSTDLEHQPTYFSSCLLRPVSSNVLQLFNTFINHRFLPSSNSARCSKATFCVGRQSWLAAGYYL